MCRMISLLLLALVLTGCATSKTQTMNDLSPQAKTVDVEQKQTRTPVIIELFTSEGCSSCPPADRVLANLSNAQPIEGVEVIALSEHVDYWNRLGWADPFSAAQFSDRQGEYSDFFGKGGSVYTPQAVVDGTREFAGHNDAAARKAIAEAAKDIKGNIAFENVKTDNGAISVEVKIENLPKISNNDAAIVLLALTEDNLTTDVARGENAGQKLPHTGVVRYLQNIGAIAGDKTLSASIKLPREWKQTNLNLVAFVQQTGSRKILAAAKRKLF